MKKQKADGHLSSLSNQKAMTSWARLGASIQEWLMNTAALDYLGCVGENDRYRIPCQRSSPVAVSSNNIGIL